MTSRMKVTLAAVTVLVAAAGVAALLYLRSGSPPATPTEQQPQPTGFMPSHDPSYWNSERMRSAVPEDMPGVPPDR